MGDESQWSRVKSEIYSILGRNPRSNKRIVSVADLDPSHSVLDIGCGPGAAVRAAAPLVVKAVGVDRSEAMIEIARRRSRGLDNVEFAVGPAEELPFPDGSFARIWTIHAYHHWEDRDRGVLECLRVLGAGGKLLIVETETKGSHGLSRDAAEGVAAELLTAGFVRSFVSKSHKQLIVTGVAG